LAVAAFGVAGCGGGSGLPAKAVVDVAGNVVSKTMFDHWVSVAAVRDFELMPTRPVPRWVIPDPPRYTACIAHLASTAGAHNALSSTAKLKVQCEQNYQALRVQVLRALITAEWFTAEAHKRGLKATDSAVRQRYERVKTTQFPSEAAFQRYLSYTGETIADQMFRSKIKVLSAELEQSIMGGRTGRARQQAMSTFITEIQKWVARTDCRTGYVVPGCKQYKGSAPIEGTSL
jgi:hypothetical protein